jgi:hypothetical protein
LILGLGLLVAALGGMFLWLLPAFRFLSNYERRLATPSTDLQRKELNLPLSLVHLYPTQNSNGAVLILVPGIHPNGIHDRRFSAFAETCAEAGFYVVAPDIPEFRNFHITHESVNILKAILNALPSEVPAENRKRIGMLGISYGAGPMFLIAAESDVDFLVSVGGYFNLLHTLEYSFTGAHPGDQNRGSHEWGRLIFAINHLSELVAPQDEEIVEKSLSLRLQLKVKEAEQLESQLSPDGKELMQGILTGLTETQKDLFLNVLLRRKEEAIAMSPEHVLNQLDPDTHIYLLHGPNDDAIPFEETIELQKALVAAGFDPHTLITPAITHVDFSRLSDLWESVKFAHWIRLFLRER